MSPEFQDIPLKVLVVDDEENIRKSIQRLLTRENYCPVVASSGLEGLEILRGDPDIALVISDHRMPGMSGVEFLEKARETSPDAIRVILTGYGSKDAAVDSINRGGAHRFLEKPWKEAELLSVVFDSLQRFAMVRENRRLHAVVREQNVLLQQWNDMLGARVKEQTAEIVEKNTVLRGLNTRLERIFHETLVAFATLLEIRHQDESTHSRDTAELSRILCERMGVSLAETAETVIAARLHDIGKIGLPDALARKTVEMMDQPEYTQYKSHSILGQTALDTVEDLRDAAVLIRHHHERHDGCGFPDRLKGDGIPAGARIIALADFLDRTIRSHPGANPIEETVRLARLRLSRHFDPRLAPHLDGLLEKVYSARLADFRVHEVELQPSDLRVGMILVRDLRSGTGFPLLMRGTVLSEKNIESVRRHHRMDPFKVGVFVTTAVQGEPWKQPF